MMEPHEYIEKRVVAQQSFFSSKAADNKKKFYIISITKLGVSLLITVISALESGNSPVAFVISILSTIVAFIEGVSLLCKHNENWIIYRITSENLKREKFLFETSTGEYNGLEENSAFNLFVQNIESIIQCSNKQWESVYKNRKEK